VAEAVLQMLVEADVEGLLVLGDERSGHIEERVRAFLDRPLAGEWPYLCWTSANSGQPVVAP
jgi:hypothetical protein